MKSLIKQNCIKRNLNKKVREMQSSTRVFKNYSDIKSVLLVCEISDIGIYEEIKKVLGLFKKDGKKVDVVLFVNDSSTYNFLSKGTSATILTKDNFTWNGKLVNNLQSELLGYDLLVNLNEQAALYPDYITCLSDACLKAGSAKNNPDTLDFMIDGGETHHIPFLAEQIIFYLRTINAKRG